MAILYILEVFVLTKKKSNHEKKNLEKTIAKEPIPAFLQLSTTAKSV